MGTIAPTVTKGHEATSGTTAYTATALANGASLTLNGGTTVTGAVGTEIAGLDVATNSNFSVKVTVTAIFGATIAGTSGVQVYAYRRKGGSTGGRVYAVVWAMSGFIPAVASGTGECELDLDASQDWQIKITNLDATNGITSIAVTIDKTVSLTD